MVDYARTYPLRGNRFRVPLLAAAIICLALLTAITRASTESIRRGALVRSAHGQPQGPYREYVAEPNTVRVFGPFIHSVTDTTVNIEWWLSELGELTITWRKQGSSKWYTAERASNRSGTFSITGLEPRTRYELRLKVNGGRTVQFAQLPANASVDKSVAVLQFTTLSTRPPASNYYVAPDGSDGNSGTSRAQAWRTIRHAASKVVSGDTVWIAAGSYPEAVRLRTAGEKGRPITFRSLPGERVVLDGMNRTLDFAFLAVDKPYQRFDGLYFTGYSIDSNQMPWRVNPRSSTNNGHFVIYESPDVHITRCFFDCRGQGTGPALAHIRDSSDILIENCVIVAAMNSALEIFWNSPRVVVRNNVFLRNFINQISAFPRGPGFNSEKDCIRIENNIITDNLDIKTHVSLVTIHGQIRYRDNIFYLRPERTNIPGSINPLILDPEFAWSVGRSKVTSKGEPVLFFDRLASNREIDFPDLFATNPVAVQRQIGLRPEAFESLLAADRK